MRITFKLFASLGDYLPDGAKRNAIDIEIEQQDTLNSLLDRYRVPRELAHLVLVNGIYQGSSARDRASLKEGDTVAVWPPVAGG